MVFRSLVKSTFLLGSSSVANTLIGIIRVKVLALLVGPAGVGLLGALSAVASLGTTVAALGSDTSGTRRIALSRDSEAAVARVRAVLLAIAVIHGLATIGVFYFGRAAIAHWVFGSQAYADEVALLGIAVALSLIAGLQIAQLQGLGQAGVVARVSVLSSLMGTAFGLLAVWQWGVGGIIVLVLAQPMLAALVAYGYTARLSGSQSTALRARWIATDWWGIISQGSAYMLSYVMLALVPLAIRALIIREIGMDAAGYFHASWTMSVIYVGFLLNAMSADYFPRLTALIDNRPAAISLINDQVQLGLAIGGPILLAMLAGAPWIVPMLYSNEFLPAVEVFQWQALGNLMKIAGWPVAFLSMARGRSGQFFLIEFAWCSLFFVVAWLGLASLGLAATGIGFAAGCIVYFLLQWTVAAATYGFRWERQTISTMLAYLFAGLLTLLAAQRSHWLQLAVGGTFAIGLGLVSVRFICAKIGDEGRLVHHARHVFDRIGWPLPVAA